MVNTPRLRSPIRAIRVLLINDVTQQPPSPAALQPDALLTLLVAIVLLVIIIRISLQLDTAPQRVRHVSIRVRAAEKPLSLIAPIVDRIE